ncbi:helix-turn-helix domain-containing protein [Embleya sp. NBC_00896]|uniref:helix-turn-helix domain-containing protein n=1 Tax=Embleya sp. NBC_00896 TaxID=2975961 RepID=UPI002F918742|nr:helix-turn-helix domain-containing protein [Embleya sp. NBC_00896]
MRDAHNDQEDRQRDGSDIVHDAMISSAHAWTLEQNDRRLDFATDAEATMFAETGAAGVTRHLHPAWKIVLSISGHVEIGQGGRTIAAPGLIVPPQLAHTATATSSYAALFVDCRRLPASTQVTRLDEAAVRRILAALGRAGVHAFAGPADLSAALTELTAATGAGDALDPRVAHALREIAHPDATAPIGAVAADVGLSPPRLRTLVRESVGIPLVRLRQWARLRTAIANLPRDTVAAGAATAGFADQAHLTRMARTMLGRTPASLRPTTGSCGHQ